jgi:hypothetical protein
MGDWRFFFSGALLRARGSRGYEVARGHYLIVSDEELDAIEIASTHTVEIDSFVPPASSRRDQRKSPAKRRAGPAFGYAGDGLPSRCIRRYRLPSRCTRKKFHARPEQGNGPAADGASFSLTLKFIGVRKEPLFPSEGLSRLTSLLRETRLRGWGGRTRTQKCRRKLSL